MTDRLVRLLADLSWRKGPVTLASGKVSDFYIDCKQTALNAEGAKLIGERVWERIVALRAEGHDIRGVGGLTLGADPIGLAAALVSAGSDDPVHAFIIRKEPKGHGTAAWLEGGKNLPQGSKVVIAEDVITTGGSTLKAITRARESGLEPVAVVVLVDRQEGGKETVEEQSGLPVYPIVTRAAFDAL